jgi:transposase
VTAIIGIDPHKASHTATAIDNSLVEIGTIRVRSSRTTFAQLIGWAQQWPDRRWAIEGARGLGQLLAQQLVAAGEHVVDVPATLTARVRLLETGHGRKSDRIDARAVAIVAAQRPDLPRVTADDHTRVLRLLADRRDELTRERRRTTNRLHRHLRDLIPGGAPTQLSAKTASRLLAGVRPCDSVTAERKQVARELIADIRRLDQAIANNRKRCQAAVAASGTTLTTIRGISDVLAAKILGHVGDVRRFASADHLASYAGTAPIEASSGDVIRHRLSRRGNRQLNHAMYLTAHVQTIFPGQGRTYYERQLAAGKSRAEALRSLKRQLIKAIYRTLIADTERVLTPAA